MSPLGCPNCTEPMKVEVAYQGHNETIAVGAFCEGCKIEFYGILDRISYQRDQMDLFS
jgi:hypothetical protein